MPQGEAFWNPYRWVQVSDQPIQHREPCYHHRFQGLSGRIECTLEALTPLIIGDGRGNFVTHRRNGQPYIPATSLKGAIRSLAELVGNAASPFRDDSVDAGHRVAQARVEKNGRVQYDIVARTFGYLHDSKVFAGLIQFSDAELLSKAPGARWEPQRVVVARPRPDSHKPFYPDTRRRKLYHHVAGLKKLIEPPPDIRQVASPRPAPPGTQFAFTVEFRNLRDEELALLLYCLVLEERVEVTLSAAALGPEAKEPVTLIGPMRHKVGGCKPHGGGSVHIQVTRLTVCTDPLARYRGRDSATTYEGDSLKAELEKRIAPYKKRSDRTMQQLRAMMIYTADDPRRPVHYPTHLWFNQNPGRPLKPTC